MIWKGKKVLVTGSGGFIGSHLAERLKREGHKIYIMDNYVTGKEENLEFLPELLFSEDISDVDEVYRAFKWFEPDLVLHLAASYKDPNDWYGDSMTNVVGTANVCEMCKKFNVQKIIYFQTSLCYGLNPWRNLYTVKTVHGDAASIPIPIDFPLNPALNSYAVTKTAAERMIALSGIPFTSFRLANIYGPRNLTGVIPTFYKKIVKKEKCIIADTRRDFVFVDDLVELILRAVNGEGKQGYYHVSSGKDYSIKEVFVEMIEEIGIATEYDNVERSPDDAPSILLDNSITLEDFYGWTPRTSLVEGLQKAIAWYKEYPPQETFTHLRNSK